MYYHYRCVLRFDVTDISDTQKSSANVDGTEFVAQVFAVWLPAPVVATARQLASDHSDSTTSGPLKIFTRDRDHSDSTTSGPLKIFTRDRSNSHVLRLLGLEGRMSYKSSGIVEDG